MIKSYKIENLDCANCARKMEERARKVHGVDNVTINFMTEKIKIDADSALFPFIVDDVEKVCQQIEKDVEIIR